MELTSWRPLIGPETWRVEVPPIEPACPPRVSEDPRPGADGHRKEGREAIARAIAFAIDQPPDVDVGDIVVRPTAQD